MVILSKADLKVKPMSSAHAMGEEEGAGVVR